MLAKDILTSDEKELDSQLGYPRGYAKLCRHAHIQMQGLITPFTEGPPQRYLPYAPLDEELAKVKEFDSLFPIVDEAERDPSSARCYAGYLWQQLDHLGNAGFDPAKFRVDVYGNVLYWSADPGSPLAWEVDHWFPHSRGGKTVVSNLRIVQWQVNQRKSTKLEFLVPWWDLKLGASINQFLSVFSSKNVDFRQRAFSLFFVNGENEQLDENVVVECHSWPQPFRERKHQVGLAAASIVRVQRPMDDSLRALNSNRALKQSNPQAGGAATPARRRWTDDEEDALKRALQKFGPGHWKEIKEYEPLLVNRSTIQIKDKYRLLKGEWDKENREESSSDHQLVLLQKEEQLKQARAEEKKQKEEHLFQLEAELQELKDHNEKEKVVLEDLEHSLAKQRKRVEKQRKWSEMQSQYRQCLEKMIRDTMHQCVLFKEQARLNQAACNALLARLESQKTACDSAEMDMMKRVKQRESLEALARPKITKRTRNDGHSDVGGCIKLNVGTSVDAKDEKTAQKERPSEKDRCKGSRSHRRRRSHDSPKQFSPILDGYDGMVRAYDPSVQDEVCLHECSTDLEQEDLRTSTLAPIKNQQDALAGKVEAYGLNVEKAIMPPLTSVTKGPEEENGDNQYPKIMNHVTSPDESNESAGMKRKAIEANDLDVRLLRHEFEEAEDRQDDSESADSRMDRKGKPEAGKTRDDQQLDELLQEVLDMKGKVTAAMEDAIEDDEERTTHAGKFNLDKWLQVLLLPGKDPNGNLCTPSQPDAEDCTVKSHETVPSAEGDESVRGGMLKNLLTKINVKQQGHIGVERLGAATEGPKSDIPSRKEPVNETKEGREQGSTRRHVGPYSRPTNPSCKKAAGLNATISASEHKAKVDCHDKASKAEERKVIESFSRLKLSSDSPAPNAAAESSAENSEVAFQIACETEFVQKMKATREREQRRKMLANAGMRPQLQDLMADSTSAEPSQEQEERLLSSPFRPAFVPAPLQIEARPDTEQRRSSLGGVPTKPQNQLVLARHQQPSPLTPFPKKPQFQQHAEQQLKHLNPQQNSPHHPQNSLQQHPQSKFQTSQQNLQYSQSKFQTPQQNLRHPRKNSSHPMERSSSTPPEGQCRQLGASSPAHYGTLQPGIEQTEQEYPKQGQPSTSTAPQLLRQLTAGHVAATVASGGVVGGGGAARKASMLMKSASTRASSSSGGSPARSSSSGGGGAGRRSGEGEAEVASVRRKASFFQDWDVNENFRASLSHVWKKAVKKFDLVRQQPQQQPHQ
ncbi:hypothetical protein GOP47_0008105 [Adiantum capillus-veneris]|uniref:Myb-like domain-containing protein n=1 Tax=Adiantum capillus-veneris TaxID=13818 RepID=A0A9D4UYA8_ADICA|nr:hypothetical protein GOP47_0008105 [Adiantum capillus-veneris]